MKKSIAAVLTVLLMTSAAGCSGGDINTKIDKRYGNLESYTARVRVTVQGSGKSENYEFAQSWKAPDKYKSEILSPEHLKGTVSIINSDGIWLKSGDAPPAKIEQAAGSMSTEYMFLSDFLADYYSEENTEKSEADEEGKILLNAADRGKNSKRFTQNLLIDSKTNMPYRLSTFDIKGNEMLRVEYDEFVPDAKLEDSVFMP